MTRVAFVGANSIEFIRADVIDLCQLPGLEGLELTLHDIDPARLAHAEALARQVARQTGSGATVRACRDRAEALAGAAYVVCELEVGGIAATRVDFEIPARYGVRQSVGDTIGIGGICRGLRTLPVVVAIAQEMVAHCPDAYLLNYTNPMAMSTWAAYEATPTSRTYGLCHAVPDTHHLLAKLVGVDPAEVDFRTAGVNHQAFVLRFAHRGASLYPRLADALARQPDFPQPVAAELFHRFGYFSTDHLAEYLPWMMRHDGELARLRISLNQHEPSAAETHRELADDQRQLAAGELADLTPSGALAPLFIHAVETRTDRELYLNVRNGGLIPNLPDDGCVEVPCRLAGGRVEPTAVGALPPQLAALNRTFLNVVELTVRAVLDGDRRHVYHAALLDPNTAATLTMAETVAMCDELLAAHRTLLPPELAD